MKRFAAILLVLIAGFFVYWFFFKHSPKKSSGPKMAPMALKKHSPSFNASIDKMVNNYIGIKNALIEDDSVLAKQNAQSFVESLDSIPMEELKKDAAGIFETAHSNLDNIRANAKSLVIQPDILEMRKDFSMVTEMLYPSFFKSINYEGHNLYLQKCPMAFGDDQPADWISLSTEIVNPYLGKHHPEYKATMLHCGEVKDTIKAE